MGKEGECTILYDTATNSYITDIMEDLHPYRPGGPKTYREARDGPVEGYEEAKEFFLQ